MEALVVRMARENRDWGYERIQGALSNLGHAVGRTTIADILRRHGIEPAPERTRKTPWKEFLSQHWELIVAADFFTVEVWTRRGLQRFFVLFFMELTTRKVEIAGIVSAASGLWMSQIGRNLADAGGGILNGKRYLIHDRDPLFIAEFLEIVASVGVKSAKLPPRSRNLNAHAERFVRTIKESCLDRMILFGEGGGEDRRLAVRESLPERAQSPGAREPDHRPGVELRWAGGFNRAATAPRRAVELLLSGRRVMREI